MRILLKLTLSVKQVILKFTIGKLHIFSLPYFKGDYDELFCEKCNYPYVNWVLFGK